MKCDSIPFSELPIFHSLIQDYLSNNEDIESLITDFPSEKSLLKRASGRQFSNEKREVLVEVLKEQYTGYALNPKTLESLESLKSNKTFTITTGHQLCLNMGPLYLVYKVASVISLTQKLNQLGSEHDFIPVFWMATEDHDFEEVNHFHVFNGRYVWNNDLKGAVGEMTTAGIQAVLEEASLDFNLNQKSAEWLSLAKNAYAEPDLAQATRKFVHELFKEYGLLILDGNHPRLKGVFSSTLKQELVEMDSAEILDHNLEFFDQQKYKIQVHPREINLFYLKSGIRERIVFEESNYKVLNTNITWSQEELLKEVQDSPEHFSPNVILRPLYQEYILPNIATIGGAGEISYWLELKDLFDKRSVEFPILLVRDSALFIKNKSMGILLEANLEVKDLFQTKEGLKGKIAASESSINLKKYSEEIQKVYSDLAKELGATDKVLEQAADVELNKALKGLDNVEKRLLRSLKSQHETQINRVLRVQEEAFPNGVFQERKANPLQILLTFDQELIELLVQNFNPLDKSVKLFVG